jgi:hypothetical protein
MKVNIIYKLISFLLVNILILSSVSSHLVFKYLEKQIKKEIKSKLLSGDFTKEYLYSTMSYDDFYKLNWENYKEFILDKNIYDLVSVEYFLDYVKVEYYLDIKETNLRQNYFSYLSSYLSENADSKNLFLNFIEIILAKYILKNHYFTLIFDYFSIKTYNIQQNFNSIYLEIPNPPPQI